MIRDSFLSVDFSGIALKNPQDIGMKFKNNEISTLKGYNIQVLFNYKLKT